MNQKDKLIEATIRALTGKLTEAKSKYHIVYYLNSATAERRPETIEDVENDWREEDKQFGSAVEALEYVFKEILDYSDSDIRDYFYKNTKNDEEKVDSLESALSDQDWGEGTPIIVSIKGSGIDYNSGFEKPDVEEDNNDEEELDEPKRSSKRKKVFIKKDEYNINIGNKEYVIKTVYDVIEQKNTYDMYLYSVEDYSRYLANAYCYIRDDKLILYDGSCKNDNASDADEFYKAFVENTKRLAKMYDLKPEIQIHELIVL